MARVKGEDRAQQRSGKNIVPVVPVVGDATETAQAGPRHQQAL